MLSKKAAPVIKVISQGTHHRTNNLVQVVIHTKYQVRGPKGRFITKLKSLTRHIGVVELARLRKECLAYATLAEARAEAVA